MCRQPTISFELDAPPGFQLVQGRGLCNRFGRHAHRSLSLGLIQAGSRRLVLAGGPIVLSDGDLFVIPADCAHAVATLDPETYSVVNLAPELLGERLDFEPGILRNARLSAKLLALVESDTARRPALLADLLRELQACGRRPLGTELKPAAVRRLIGHLQSNFDAALKLDDLAALAGLSPWHLQRLCVVATGLSPHDHLELIRIREACRLLRQGERPAAVALATGFCDQSHFNRCFKRRMGTTPRQYAVGDEAAAAFKGAG